MNQSLKKNALPALRWTLGLVVIFESIRFLVSPSAAHFLAKIGLPQWVRPALGGSEIIAAILFLVPATSMVGGWLLLLIFALAATFHFLHGAFDVGGLVVYGMAVIVCMAQPDHESLEASRDRR